MNDFDFTKKDVEPRKPDRGEPWWNDSDKVAGAAATIVVMAAAIFIFACVIKLVTLMF